MTRGTLILINNLNILSSVEFNGSFYPEYYGDVCFDFLDNKVSNEKDFKKFITSFNKVNFQYKEQLFYKIKEDKFYTSRKENNFEVDLSKLSESDYFNLFSSDYTIIKNVSSKKIIFIDRKKKKHILKKENVLRLNYGEINKEISFSYDKDSSNKKMPEMLEKNVYNKYYNNNNNDNKSDFILNNDNNYYDLI